MAKLVKAIEEKWQKRWLEERVFEPDIKAKPKEKKFYITVAFPYLSGHLHVGHARTYTIPDVIARFKRMQGYNVLFPMAWHITGAPIVGIAERIKNRDPKTIHIYREGSRGDTLEVRGPEGNRQVFHEVREGDLHPRGLRRGLDARVSHDEPLPALQQVHRVAVLDAQGHGAGR